METSLRRVLVTGGCGFVGREVSSRLMENGYDVVVADNLSNPQSWPKPEFNFHRLNMEDPAAARMAFTDVDACIALASHRGAIGYVGRHPTEILTGNSSIYNATFKAAVEAKVKRLVFISSSMVFESAQDFPTPEERIESIGVPVSFFGFSKMLGEMYCRSFHQEFGLNYTIIRPSNVYGINELPEEKVGDSHVIPDLFKKIVSGQYPVELLGDGRQTRCFVHVDDIARGIVKAFESTEAENEDFNVGGTEEVQILELARMIWDFCGMDKDFEVSHVEGFAQDVNRQFMDVGKAMRLLDWEPQISFRDGLKEVVEWLKKEYNA